MTGVCDVCEILDKDKTTKYITYCSSCNAYICNQCENNWLRRGMAAIKKQLKAKQ